MNRFKKAQGLCRLKGTGPGPKKSKLPEKRSVNQIQKGKEETPEAK